MARLFQSTQPSQAVTIDRVDDLKDSYEFQSTQPSQAVTIDRVDALKDSYEFQSTQPSQAVTKEIETLSAYIKISIHTALAGCD